MMQVFEDLAKLLSELDVLLSFADLAASSPTPYTRPDITPSVRIMGLNFIGIFSYKTYKYVLYICRILEISY